MQFVSLSGLSEDRHTASHTAWRSIGNNTAYVEHVSNGQQRGDRYSYTDKLENAKQMTEAQCRAFCAYMKDCSSVGFWS